MKRTILTAGVLLALCATVAAEDAGKEAVAGRKAWLVKNVDSFTLTLQYDGEQDPKSLRWSMTLATRPIDRLAMPVAQSDVVIDEKLALKIIDRLEKDGFLARAQQDVKAEHLTPCYILQIAAGGHRLEENLGWSLDTFRRIDALAQVLEGDAAKAMQRVLDSIAGVRAKMEAAESVKKLKGDLDHFELTLYYDGHPEQKTALYSLTLSTQAKEYAARAPNSLDAVVTKDEALKIIAWLEKTKFFEQAQEALDREVAHPIYMLTVRGGGVKLGEDIGWGKPLLDKLESLRDILNPNAADQLGKLMTAVKKALPAEPTKGAEEKADAPRLRIAAERAKKLRANLKDFNLTLQYQGPAPDAVEKPYYMLQLFTNPAVRRKVPENLLLAQIDEETAGKIVDYLATSDVLDRAFEIVSTHAAEPMGPPGRSYVLYVGRYQDFLVFDRDLAANLRALRALLTGEAAKQMDLLMDRAGIRLEDAVAAERSKALKADLDAFALRLRYVGPEDKPFYWLLLSTKPQDAKHKYQMERETIIDRETASKLIDRLAATGVLAKAWDPREAQARRAGPEARYMIDIFGGDQALEGDLGWGKDLADHLLGLRALLAGDAAKQMDILIGRLGGYWKDWTGKPYQP